MQSKRLPSCKAEPALIDATRASPSFRAWIFVATVLLAGCKANLVTGVAEYDANEAVSILLSGGISAEKVPAGEQTFNVVVGESDFGRALQLMTDAGLPRERRASLGELFKREGFVSTASEERIRYTFGLSQELERTIVSIDGVASARVHVAMPSGDPLSTQRKPSSASIFVRYREPAVPSEIGPLIRAVVTRAIEGLDPERVSIAFTPASGSGGRTGFEPVSWFGLWVASSSLHLVMLMVLAPWAVMLALGAAAWYLGYSWPVRSRAAPGAPTQPKRSRGKSSVLRDRAEPVK